MPLKGIKIELATHKRLKQAAAARSTTIQEIVEAAVAAHLAENLGTDSPELGSLDVANKKRISFDGPEVKESESPWVQGLLKVLRGKNERAKNAITSNILAFADYSTHVPEADSDEADSAAIRARLAAIRELVDSRESGNAGGDSANPKIDRALPRKAGRK